MKVGMVLPEAGQQATRENIIQAAKASRRRRMPNKKRGGEKGWKQIKKRNLMAYLHLI
jgi:hypothetical protein